MASLVVEGGSDSEEEVESEQDGDVDENESEVESSDDDDSDDDSDDDEEDEENEEDDDEDSVSTEESIDSSASDLMDFKVTVASTQEIRGFTIPACEVFKRLKHRLQKDYKSSNLKLSYIDAEGDKIVMRSQKDFSYILRDYNKTIASSDKPPQALRLQAELLGGTIESTASLSVDIPQSNISHASESKAPEQAPSPRKVRLDATNQNGTKELVWQKGELIGSGSYGKVYRCIDSISGEILAVKEVRLRKGSKYKHQALAMQQELQVLSTLEHPNIIRYLGAEYTHNMLRIFLELAPEGSVKDAINEFGAFGEPLLRRYVKDILSGLAFLHAQRYVHRDIKPTNLLINKNTVKLADFGCAIASLADSHGKSAGLEGAIGTTIYMSPEVMGGGGDEAGNFSPVPASKYGRKADIWSLGITMVEMANGEAPFRTAASAIYRVCVTKDYPSLPESLSAEAHHFISRCLVENPADRGDCEELADLPFTQPLLLTGASFKLTQTKSDRHTASTLMFNPLRDYHEFGNESISSSSKDFESPSKSDIYFSHEDDQAQYSTAEDYVVVVTDKSIPEERFYSTYSSVGQRDAAASEAALQRNVRSAPGAKRGSPPGRYYS